MRWTSGGRVDTLAPTQLEVPGGANLTPLPKWDSWAAGPSGRIALVRNQAHYRLDWVAPEGTLVTGPEIRYQSIPVKLRADQEKWLETRGQLAEAVG